MPALRKFHCYFKLHKLRFKFLGKQKLPDTSPQFFFKVREGSVIFFMHGNAAISLEKLPVKITSFLNVDLEIETLNDRTPHHSSVARF